MDEASNAAPDCSPEAPADAIPARSASAGERHREHVLVVSPVIPTSIYRGSETRVSAIVRALSAQGFRVSLAVLNMSRADATPDVIAQEIHAELPFIDEVHVLNHPRLAGGVRGRLRYGALIIVDLLGGGMHRIHGHRTCPPPFRHLVADLCRRLAPDFLLVNYAKLAPVIPPHFGGVTVVDTHDYQTRFLEEDQRLNRMRRHVHRSTFQRSEQAAVGRFDRIMAINPEERDVFVNMCPTREVFFVPAFTEPVPASSREPAPPTCDALFVGSQSSFNVSGLSWFIDEVLPIVLRSKPDFRLSVVGDIQRARPLATRRVDGVKFLGVVDRLDPFYAGARCVVAPLLGGAGMKIKVVEALGHGKAVIATPTALEGIRFEDGRDVLVARGAGDFAASVLRVVEDSSLRRELEDGARSLHAREHSPAAVARALEAVFHTAAPRAAVTPAAGT